MIDDTEFSVTGLAKDSAAVRFCPRERRLALNVEILDRGSPLPQFFDELSYGLPPSIAPRRLRGTYAQERRRLISVKLLSDQSIDLLPQTLDRADRVLSIAATQEQPSGKWRTIRILLRTWCSFM
jgi:hypothetical protein